MLKGKEEEEINYEIYGIPSQKRKNRNSEPCGGFSYGNLCFCDCSKDKPGSAGGCLRNPSAWMWAPGERKRAYDESNDRFLLKSEYRRGSFGWAGLLGTEHILKRRAVSEEVGRRILDIAKAAEARINAMGVDIRGTEPSPGNIAGGLTTLEEKALGAIRKGGTTSIKEVIDYAQKPSQKGLIIMDGPAHDVISNIGMIASGAQLIVFTTGRGTPVGSPVAPVIKVSSNSRLYNCMQDNIDINAGTILDGYETIQSVGEKIFHEMIEVSSGKETLAETLGHCEFAIHPIGPTV